MRVSRLVKFEGSETLEDARQMITKLNGQTEKIPLQI
jgi:hypothetical protein